MKANDITKCICCGKGLMEGNRPPVFLRMTIEYRALNLRAIQRRHGEEAFMGPLAGVLGLNEDIDAEMSRATGLICGNCMTDPDAVTIPFELFEAMQPPEKEAS